MKVDSAYYLTKLKEKYLWLRSGEIILLALAAACFVFGLTSFFNIGIFACAMIAAGSGIIVAAALTVRSGLLKFDENRLVVFINHQYPVMQHSTDLLFKDERTLTSLEQIQKEKISPHFEKIFDAVELPHQINKALLVLGASVILTATMFFFAREFMIDPLKINKIVSTETSSTMLPASVEQLTVSVTPPAYTGQKPYTSQDPNLLMPEGSLVRWQVLFTDTVQDARLVFAGNDSLRFSSTRENHQAERTFSESNIYQLSWRAAQGEVHTSAYYKAEVIRDQPPRIIVAQQPEHTEVRFDEAQKIPLKVKLSDDYGLKDAYIIATVSNGSGESVKFREERLPFTSPARINGRQSEGFRMIDLKALGLEPGDELYFYIEAMDNKKPLANRSRTQTYFISLQDTAAQMLSVEAGLGVDLMPSYFRSQRQIIIDSEKLLRDRTAISAQEFNSRSNEIGYDQKVLRLKYGEFLGEEFETDIGPGAEPAESEHEEAHHHEEGEEKDPIEAYKHIHDDPEEATFFTQSIRAKLKAALSAMWDAELHLRTFDPKSSLPYQYIALRLLKEISQDSRIYVHRTGFDPPPLKEEKRLTGDLSGIRNSAYGRKVDDGVSYPAVRLALVTVEEWLSRPDSPLTINAKQTFLQAGQEFATLALNEPGNYLRVLSVIQSLSEGEISAEDVRENLLFLRDSFWKVLPTGMAAPDKTTDGLHKLDRVFIDHLKPLNNNE